MNDELILTRRDGACLTVTFNRPEKANSLTPAMLIALRDVFRSRFFLAFFSTLVVSSFRV